MNVIFAVYEGYDEQRINSVKLLLANPSKAHKTTCKDSKTKNSNVLTPK